MTALSFTYRTQTGSLGVFGKNPKGHKAKSGQAEKNALNYSTFGSLMPGRSSSNGDYRYGFNKGSEKDDEIYGDGNAYTTQFRELDPRLGRWWTIDPKPSASWSPYVAMNDNPILINDALGDSGEVAKKDVKDLSTSQKGKDFIKDYEKFESKLYNDQANNATIGYGHLVHKGKVGTDKAKEKQYSNGITKAKATTLLDQDIVDKAEKYVKADVTVKLTQNQFDALVAFTYNEGAGNLKKSTLLQKVNAGNVTDAVIRKAFKAYNKVTQNGKLVTSAGLTKRRGQEADIYLKNVYNSTH